MILPRFEDLEIEWARPKQAELTAQQASPFRCEGGWLRMEGQMAGVPPCGYLASKKPSSVPGSGDQKTSLPERLDSRHGVRVGL